MIITDITGIGDPQILLYEDKYYCYATGGSPDGPIGFRVWVSDDLERWDGPFPCMDAEKSWANRSFWAPEVVEHNGKILMHYTARSRELVSLRLGVAVADHPLGPFEDVHGKPIFDLGYSTIDGSVLRCREGNFFYYSHDCGENIVNGIKTSQIFCVQLDETLTRTVGEHHFIFEPTEPWERKSLEHEVHTLWNEGPCVIERDGRYIMNYSANFFATNDYAICVATADSPLGPWKKSVNNPVLSCRGDLFGAGHNAFFTDREGRLRTSFHIQTHPENPSGDRRVVIGEVRFSERNGEIYEEIV